MSAASSPLLAFDTSGPVGSVVVSVDGEPQATRTLKAAREHASLLVPTIEAVLEDAGIERCDLAGLVVGEGPGSFTGVRVAAATAKGLAHALGLPLQAVSSLAGAAAAVKGVDPVRYALFDARGDRVYAGCWSVDDAGIRNLVAPFAGTIGDLLDDVPEGAVFTGDGAHRHDHRIGAAGHRVAERAIEAPIAEGLLRYLVLEPDHPAVAEPHAWEPSYLKESSAERLWTT